MAAPGYDLYYLNVMAGPGAERAWLICDDPAHGWVRDTWTDQAGRPPTSPWRCSMTSDTQRPRPCGSPSAQAVVRFLADQWTERDGERQKLFAGCFGIFGHGNVAGIGQALLQNELRRRPTSACPTSWPATSRRWCTPSVGLRPPEGPPADLGVHRLGRPRLDQHAHRRGAGDDQPDPRAAAAVRHLRDARVRPRCSRSSSSRMPATSPSTTPSARCRGSSTGSAVPSSCRRRCSARCGC